MQESQACARVVGLCVSLPRLLCVVVMATALTSACQGGSTEPLTVEREALLQGLTGQPTSITRTANGNFLITGVSGAAWAVAVGMDDKILWKYDEPIDSTVRTIDQSEFSGTVILGNGNILLCGNTTVRNPVSVRDNRLGLVTILGPRGELVETRRLYPNGDKKYFWSGFGQCLRWNDGILLVGGTSDDVHGFSWFMKLDKNGTKEWETVSSELRGEALEMENHDLVLAAGSNVEGVRLMRVNEKLQVLAKRRVPGNGYYGLLHPFKPSRGVQLLSYDFGGKATLYTLNDRLEDEAAPRPMHPILIDKGCGYVLADGSLALFGQVMMGAMYMAAVAHVGLGESAATHVFENPARGAPESNTVRDAIPLSESRFVAVRDRVSQNRNEAGVVLSWIRFQ
jgi:hypothetical protein